MFLFARPSSDLFLLLHVAGHLRFYLLPPILYHVSEECSASQYKCYSPLGRVLLGEPLMKMFRSRRGTTF